MFHCRNLKRPPYFLHALVAILLASCLNSFAAEETLLQLQNGDRLTGVILRADTNTITIDLAFVATFDIPVSQIKRRKLISSGARPGPKSTNNLAAAVAPAPAAILRKRQQLAELLAEHRQGKINRADYLARRLDILSAPFLVEPATPPATAVASQTSPPLATPAQNPTSTKMVAAAPPAKPATPKRKLWQFDAQLGANLQFNSHHNELYQGIFNVHYGDAQSRYRHHLNVTANRGLTDGVLSANNLNGLERTEMDVDKAKRVFLFNALGAGYDQVRKIDLSYEDSLGVGYAVLKRPNLALSFDAGMNYQEQIFSDRTRKDYFSPRLGEKAHWKISSKLDLDEVFEIFPRSVALDNYRLRFETTLRYSLSSYLSLNLRVADLHDTQPATGVTPNDLQITSTIGVRF